MAKKRGKVLAVCLTEKEHEELFAYAEKRLVCASSWARQVLLELVRRDNKESQ